MKANSICILITLVVLFLETILGHSYLTNPISRSNQRQTQTGCVTGCGPCDSPNPAANKISVQRGDTLTIQWPRNNHAGGFLRYAWALTSSANTYADFDAGVDSFFCFEIPASTCHSTLYPSDPNGNDNNDQFNCGNTITVPLWLTDGAWTLQWTWFGGLFYLGDYKSCVDYQVSGGPTGPQNDPIFYGGDATYPNTQYCKYANTRTIHQCPSEPCAGSGQGQMGTPNTTYIANPTTTTTTAAATTASATTTTASATTTTTTTTASATTASATTTTATATTTTATATTTTTGYPARMTTNANDFPLEQGPPPGMCPNTNAPNLNGDILYPAKCGSNKPGSRCPDGQCCSQSGDCGPIPGPDGVYRGTVGGVYQVITYEEALAEFCTDNQGSWAYVACEGGANALWISAALVVIAALMAL